MEEVDVKASQNGWGPVSRTNERTTHIHLDQEGMTCDCLQLRLTI